MIAENKSIRKAYHADLVVMVVEDHMLFTKEIRHALPGHTVVFASSVEDAKELYEQSLPNVTFLDIDLPDGDGFELLDYIRDREPEAYVVMLTGSKIEADVLTSRKKGARGYIIKPFTRAKVDRYIAEYIEFREKQMQSLLAETARHRQDELYLSPQMMIT